MRLTNRTGKIWIRCAALCALILMVCCGCGHHRSTTEIFNEMDMNVREQKHCVQTWTMDVRMLYEETAEEAAGTAVDPVKAATAPEAAATEVAYHVDGVTSLQASESLGCSKVNTVMERDGKEESHKLVLYTRLGKEYTDLWLKKDGVWSRRRSEEKYERLPEMAYLQNLYDMKDSFVLSADTVNLSGSDSYELKATVAPEDMVDLIRVYLTNLEDAQAEILLRMLGGVIQEEQVLGISLYVDEESLLPTTLNLSAEALGDSLTKLSVHITFDWKETVELKIPEDAMTTSEQETEAAAAGESAAEETEPAGTWTYEQLEHPKMVVDMTEEEYLLREENGVRIYLSRIYRDSDKNLYFDLHMVNDSESTRQIYSLGIAVNHTMVDSDSIYRSLDPGQEELYTVAVKEPWKIGIEKVGSFSILLMADDTNSFGWETESTVAEYVNKEKNDFYRVIGNEEDTVAYSDENIRVTAYTPVSDELNWYLPLCIENLSSNAISLSGEQMVLENGLELKGLLYGDLFADSCLYTSLRVEKKHLSELGVEDPGAITLRLSAYDHQTMGTCFTTGNFVVNGSAVEAEIDLAEALDEVKAFLTPESSEEE